MSISRAHIPALRRALNMGALPAMAYEQEAMSFFGAAQARGYDLTPGEKYAYNRWYKRMKAKGLLGKVTGAWMLAAVDPSIVPINLAAPGTNDLLAVGTPSVSRYEGCRFASGSYFDTGIAADSLVDHDDCHIAMMGETVSNSTTHAFGAVNGAGHGYSIAPGSARIRIGGALATVSSAATADGRGFVVASRNNASTYLCARNGQTLNASRAEASAELTLGNIWIGCVNNDGTPGPATDQLMTFVSIGTHMTAAETRDYYAITRTLWLAITYGCPDIVDAGVAPHDGDYDFISYGATPGGIVAAYEAARQGLRVAIVGGWRERHLGGMMAGGLGHLDWDKAALLGGVSDWVINTTTRMNGEVRSASNVVLRNSEAHVSEGAFRSMLDPRRKHGLNIKIYWSDGVDTVEKNGAEIRSITTVDGRTFRATTFHDGSYEGDLIARAGVRYRIGREAAGALAGEALNGFRPSGGGQLGVIDPYVVPGNPGSGLIPWVSPDPGLAVGAADYAEYVNRVEVYNSGTQVTTQPYNFRMAMTTDARRAVDFPSSPPAGYATGNYELYLRFWEYRESVSSGSMDFMGASPSTVLANQGILSRTVSPGVALYGMANDINSTAYPSSDWVGQNFEYPEASYTERAAMWDAHRDFTLGLIYLATHDPSPRVPAGLRSDAQQWAWVASEHLDPYEGPYGSDPLFFPKQLYVRAGRRIVGEVVMTADHLKELVPLPSTKTVGMSSYPLDSHVIQSVARLVSGTARVVLEGGFFDQSYGGADGGTPIPVEAMTPKKAECENLTSSFVISATHAANGQIRMEAASMQMAHAAGVIAAIRKETGEAVQDINYESVLRPRLFASRKWYDESPLVLRQVDS